MNINDITEDNQGSIWFASHGDGLFNIKNDSIYQQFTKLDGLASNYVYAVLIDQFQTIWTGHRNGISYKRNIKNNFFSLQNDQKLCFWY